MDLPGRTRADSAFQAVVVARSGSVALLSDTLHNVADALTAAPVGIAFLLGRRTATPRFTYGYGPAEDVAGILVVLVILGSAMLAGWESLRRLAAGAIALVTWGVAKQVLARLMDAVDPGLAKQATTALRGVHGVVDVDKVRLRWVGHALHAEVDLSVPPGISVEQAHRTAHDAEHELPHAVPRLTTATVHAHPARQ